MRCLPPTPLFLQISTVDISVSHIGWISLCGSGDVVFEVLCPPRPGGSRDGPHPRRGSATWSQEGALTTILPSQDAGSGQSPPSPRPRPPPPPPPQNEARQKKPFR